LSGRRRLILVAAASIVSATSLVAVGAAVAPCSPALSAQSAAGRSSPGGDAPGSGGAVQGSAANAARRPNLILIVTDDQRADTLRFMPNVQRLLAGHGVTFPNFYVTTSLCCPSRTSILTGQYSRHTGVFDNVGAHGGAVAFDDRSTLATWLSGAGYTTALVGKYLNGYPSFGRCYFPPGWTEWDALASEPEAHYYDYTLNHDGYIESYDERVSDYSTTVLFRKGIAFARSARQPFFLYLAPSTPHRPATRLPRDDGLFAKLPPYRPPSFDEPDVSDKPWGSLAPPMPQSRIREVDGIRRHMLESLQALDRQVALLVRDLQRSGRLGNTVIALTSDNGFLWGEHRLVSKVWPYEESIKVPLVVRVPWVTSARVDTHLVLNIDLAPTFAELAGVKPGLPEDGRSIVPLLRGEQVPWRHAFTEEWLGRPATDVGAPPQFEALHTDRYVWIEYRNGWRELYDLRSDPFELRNLAEDPEATGLRNRLRTELHRLVASPPSRA
jgi:arylsulfatase A-like enzyme